MRESFDNNEVLDVASGGIELVPLAEVTGATGAEVVELNRLEAFDCIAVVLCLSSFTDVLVKTPVGYDVTAATVCLEGEPVVDSFSVVVLTET